MSVSFFFFSSRRRHTRWPRDWSSDVCSSDLPGIRKVAFTGSTEVGMRVMQLAANDIKRVSLELGGKSANIIFEDCDPERAVASAVSSSLGNAGQDCCARSRILVQKSIYDRFTKSLVDAFEKVRVGDP